MLEFRHPGWWREEVYSALRQRGVAFCGISHPELLDEAMVTGRWPITVFTARPTCTVRFTVMRRWLD
ncbi:DUF72 domain-containing protein [Mucilaginibacter sp. SG538B]|uniref:DUF72 domain-containing protein n=1 Tax=Mucilaginibacter sp. SG538B TaxID=2587021 RepID=UPI003977C5FC